MFWNSGEVSHGCFNQTSPHTLLLVFVIALKSKKRVEEKEDKKGEKLTMGRKPLTDAGEDTSQMTDYLFGEVQEADSSLPPPSQELTKLIQESDSLAADHTSFGASATVKGSLFGSSSEQAATPGSLLGTSLPTELKAAGPPSSALPPKPASEKLPKGVAGFSFGQSQQSQQIGLFGSVALEGGGGFGGMLSKSAFGAPATVGGSLFDASSGQAAPQGAFFGLSQQSQGSVFDASSGQAAPQVLSLACRNNHSKLVYLGQLLRL